MAPSKRERRKSLSNFCGYGHSKKRTLNHYGARSLCVAGDADHPAALLPFGSPKKQLLLPVKLPVSGKVKVGEKSPMPHSGSNFLDLSRFRSPEQDPPFYDPKKWNEILTKNKKYLQRHRSQQAALQHSPPKAVTRRSSLDIKVQNLPKRSSLSKKQKRAFQRFISGIKRARYLNKRLRFFTLTTSRDASHCYFLLNEHFQILRKRINRYWGRIEYCKVMTNEGYGVIHVVCVGGFIPQQWLSRNWEEIHGSPIVDVRAVKGSNRQMAGYLASQYCSEQKASYTRMSYSWNWVFKGFVAVWYRIRNEYGLERGIREWNKVLMFRAETCSRQSILKVESSV